MDISSKKSGSQNRQEKRRQELLSGGSDPKQRKISFVSPTSCARSDAAVVTEVNILNNNFAVAQFYMVLLWNAGSGMFDLVWLYE